MRCRCSSISHVCSSHFKYLHRGLSLSIAYRNGQVENGGRRGSFSPRSSAGAFSFSFFFLFLLLLLRKIYLYKYNVFFRFYVLFFFVRICYVLFIIYLFWFIHFHKLIKGSSCGWRQPSRLQVVYCVITLSMWLPSTVAFVIKTCSVAQIFNSAVVHDIKVFAVNGNKKEAQKKKKKKRKKKKKLTKSWLIYLFICLFFSEADIRAHEHATKVRTVNFSKTLLFVL